MKRYKSISYLIIIVVVLFLICVEMLLMAGETTINVKDAITNENREKISLFHYYAL